MRLSTLVVAIAIGAAATRAARADCSVPITSPCVDSDTLWPHAGPSQFLTVGSTETTAKDRIAFGLVASYLSQPIVFVTAPPGPTPNGSGTAQPAIDNQLDVTFLFAYGLTDRLELDLALPVTVFQDGAGMEPITGCASGSVCNVPTTAARDLRFGASYAFLSRPKKHPWRHDASGFGIVGRFEMVAPTGDDGAFAAEPSAVYVPSVSVDYRSHRFFAGIELGARIRPTTDLVGARIGTQGVFAGGVGFDVIDRELLTVTAEARILPVFVQQGNVMPTANGLQSIDNGQYIAPAEWMVAARTAPWEGGDITFQLGFGGAIPTALSSSGGLFAPATTPRFRIALGISYAPKGRDTDGDGIPDAVDRCPLEPASKHTGDGTGCPK